MFDPDDVHRTAKQLFESGQVASIEEASELIKTFVLQIDVGADLREDVAGQAALLTLVNAGSRAFIGGVRVKLTDDPVLTEGWADGRRLSDIILRLGGELASGALDPRLPTLAVGDPTKPVGLPVLYLSWSGWRAAVAESPDDNLGRRGNCLSGVASAGLALSEVFQRLTGSPMAGRRDVGISLWRPELDWNDEAGNGPELVYLPSSVWLLGLGHLGQAYAWTMGLLPYADRSAVRAHLVDFDHLISGNLATGLLSSTADLNERKTRIVAGRLEELGFKTAVVERRFDEHFRTADDEPRVALAGFDKPEPRQALGTANFARVVDIGLGRGPVEYLDVLLHTFPSPLNPIDEFRPQGGIPRDQSKRYESMARGLVDGGATAAEAACGVVEFARISVAAAFVGSFASSLAWADPIRALHEGGEYSVISVDLRSPADLWAVPNNAPSQEINPGFTSAR